MKPIPETLDSPVLRTDFSDDAAWNEVCVAIETPTPDDGFQAYVEFISDPDFEGISIEQVLGSVSQSGPRRPTFLFIVDQQAIAGPEHPILVLDLYTEVESVCMVV